MPKTTLGKIGLASTLAFVILMALKLAALMPVPSFLIFGLGIAATVVNVIAVIKKDRSLLLIVVGAMVALFVIFFVGAEILFPH
ncbi:MAG: hypothetical protein ACKOWE_02285 [Micrococcales bacterium]